jgi:thiamine-monophosphate kinase
MELEFIRWLRDNIPADPRARLGLRDDAAVLSLDGRSDIVVTTDLTTDGVDFRLPTDDPRRIGRQGLGANLSDLAAMAAHPFAAFISLALPRGGTGRLSTFELAVALYEGMLPLATRYNLAIAGGDTNTYDGPLVISIAAIGRPSSRGPLTRSGARPGDWLLVTGALGGSILGHMFDFTPRVNEALVLHERYQLAAGIDISDGLALDASRLAAESKCGALIYTDRVPVSPAAIELARNEGAADLGDAALRHALGDGQDFELLISTSPETAKAILRDHPLDCNVTHVGELTAEPGLWQEKSDGVRTPLEATGWRHT